MSQSFAEALSWVPVSATFSGTLGRAHEYARAQGHRTVTLEHLLLALAEDPDAATVLQASNIDIARVMNDASTHLGHHEDRFDPGQMVDPGADEALVKILDYAAAAARQSRRREINGAIVLAAIVGEGRSVAASMLQAQGLTFEGAIKALQRPPTAAPAPAIRPAAPPAASNTGGPVAPPAQAVPPDQPATINGAATQTNEQILASVRRRIDANRTAPKAAPVVPPREPYPQPPVTEAPRQAWEEHPTIAPAVIAAPMPVPAPIAAPAPIPVPVLVEFEPVRTAPVYVPEPVPPPRHVEPLTPPPPFQHAPVHEDPYTGLYPPLPDAPPTGRPQPRPFAEDDGLQVEAYDPQAAGLGHAGFDDGMPPRLPPPLPAARSGGSASEVAPRPRQFATPVVPPSTVAWPEAVRPQPEAFAHQVAPPPQRAPLPPVVPAPYSEPNTYDGGIAGAPYPEPDSVPPRTAAKAPVPAPRRPSAKLPEPASVEVGQLVENIPRKMRVGQMEIAEVRIGRADVRRISDGMQGSAPSYLHDLVVTKAMSARLRVVSGRFLIEAASPETQWLDSRLGSASDDYASWRWNITPQTRGEGRLQVVVSARTVASDGLSADTVLPDQVFDIAVAADYKRMAKQAAGWAGLMILGGLLSRLGQGGFETIGALWRGFQ